MIYTITVNPAIDYVIEMTELELGEVNRTENYHFLAGGKGINVSQILNQLQLENIAWGFVGGFSGTELTRQVAAKDIKSDFVEIADQTRINVKLNAGQETEINGAGPKITAAEFEQFKDKLKNLNEGDTVVMSGSLTPSLPDNFYQSLIPAIKEQGADFVVDTTGQALLDTLEYEPLVIKPNHHELADLFDTTFANDDELVAAARKLLDQGAKHVLISMAGDGGYLITKDHVYQANAAKGTVVNSVGAGDSMVAGFVGTFAKTKDPVESFKVGMACGGATTFTKDIANAAQIAEILPQIEVTKIS